MNNQGYHADVEIAAYETRLYCEMLLKGALNLFEVSTCNLRIYIYLVMLHSVISVCLICI